MTPRAPFMREATRALAWAAAFASIAPSAMACGACVEDKVAATYDHAVVQGAAASGSVMVFCEVTGPLDAARLTGALRKVRGVRPASVRVSAVPAAVSFAVDPARSTPRAAVDAAQRGMPTETRLAIVKVLPAQAPQVP